MGSFLVWVLFCLTIILFSYSTFILNKWPNEVLEMFMKCLIYSATVVVFVSLLVYIFNPTTNLERIFNDAGYYQKAFLFDYIGIERERVVLPFSGGFNTMGNICGISLIVGICSLYKGNTLFVSLFSIFIGICGIFLVDSRSSLLIAILSIFTAIIYK